MQGIAAGDTGAMGLVAKVHRQSLGLAVVAWFQQATLAQVSKVGASQTIGVEFSGNDLGDLLIHG